MLEADKERAALLEEAERAHDPMRIAEIQTRLVDIDAHAAPARAASILTGLGFDEAAQNRALSEFSGGWRMRVALAAVLFSAPDLLLLDEPTNYLDLEGALWLVDYLKTYPATVDRHLRMIATCSTTSPTISCISSAPSSLYGPAAIPASSASAREQQIAAGQGGQEAGGEARPSAILRRPLPRQRDQGDAGAVAPQNAGQDGAGRRRSSTKASCRSAGRAPRKP